MLNQVVLVGRIVKTPELRVTETGKKTATVTLAVPRNYKNMNKLRKFVNVPSNRKNDLNNIHHKALTLPKNSYKENALLKEKELINIDDELQKIISDSLNKAKGTSGFNATVNPLADVKKKELNKLEPGKFRLFTKKDNKIIIQEVDRNKKEGTVEETEEEREDDYDDDEEED